MNRIAAALAAGLLLAGCGGRPSLHGSVPSRLTYVGGASLPEVHPGRPGREFAFRARPGRVLAVYFGYVSCPDVCPTTLSDLAHAIRSLGAAGGRVDVAFATVDLYRDSAAVLAPYLASFTPAGHPLLADSPSRLAAAEVAFGATSNLVKKSDGGIEVEHTAQTYVVDDAGRVVLTWRFGTTAADMADDLRALLRAAGRDRKSP